MPAELTAQPTADPPAPGARVDVSVELRGLDDLELRPEPRPGVVSRAFAGAWPKVVALAIVVGLWQLLVWSGWRPRFALAGPGDVWPELTRMWEAGDLTTAVGLTMSRALGGYLLAMVIGITLGIVVASTRVLRVGFGSLITGLQTMPSVAWFPLAILLFGITEQAILFVVVLGAAPSIANGLISGVDNVPPLYRRAGRVLGAGRIAQWRFVILPAAVPGFVGGMKQGWAFAWRSLLAGELLVIVPGQRSLGVLLQTGRDLSNSAMLLASMVVILAVGILVDTLGFGRLERAVRHRHGLDPL
jgi:NitT/TauT family transport system permease protein